MNTIVRTKLETKIEELLNDPTDSNVDLAIFLALLEFDNASEIRPLLKVIIKTSENTDEILQGWANVLDDFIKLV